LEPGDGYVVDQPGGERGRDCPGDAVVLQDCCGDPAASSGGGDPPGIAVMNWWPLAVGCVSHICADLLSVTGGWPAGLGPGLLVCLREKIVQGGSFG
jgi:hypothetical protein